VLNCSTLVCFSQESRSLEHHASWMGEVIIDSKKGSPASTLGTSVPPATRHLAVSILCARVLMGRAVSLFAFFARSGTFIAHFSRRKNSLAFGYVIAQISVTDPEIYAEYIKLVLPTIEHYGGEFLVRGGQSVSYEGEPSGDRNVVIRFPSYQAAHDWYHSEEYSTAKALRRSASTSVQTIVEGL